MVQLVSLANEAKADKKKLDEEEERKRRESKKRERERGRGRERGRVWGFVTFDKGKVLKWLQEQ